MFSVRELQTENKICGYIRVTLKMSYSDLAQLEATVQMGFKEGLLSAMTNLDKIIEG